MVRVLRRTSLCSLFDIEFSFVDSLFNLIELRTLLHKPIGISLEKGIQPEDEKFVQRKF